MNKLLDYNGIKLDCQCYIQLRLVRLPKRPSEIDCYKYHRIFKPSCLIHNLSLIQL